MRSSPPRLLHQNHQHWLDCLIWYETFIFKNYSICVVKLCRALQGCLQFPGILHYTYSNAKPKQCFEYSTFSQWEIIMIFHKIFLTMEMCFCHRDGVSFCANNKYFTPSSALHTGVKRVPRTRVPRTLPQPGGQKQSFWFWSHMSPGTHSVSLTCILMMFNSPSKKSELVCSWSFYILSHQLSALST